MFQKGLQKGPRPESVQEGSDNITSSLVSESIPSRRTYHSDGLKLSAPQDSQGAQLGSAGPSLCWSSTIGAVLLH